MSARCECRHTGSCHDDGTGFHRCLHPDCECESFTPVGNGKKNRDRALAHRQPKTLGRDWQIEDAQ